MAQEAQPDQTTERALDRLQKAEFDLVAGPVKVQLRVQLTTSGLLAIGALVSGILLASSAIVWSATSVARRHPLASRIRTR